MRTTRLVFAGGLLAAALLPASAHAAYTAQVQGDTLEVTGDGASDRLHLDTAAPGTLVIDVGIDGTADFSFDKTTFTTVEIAAGGGEDEVALAPGAVNDKTVNIDGGGGDDTLLGGLDRRPCSAVPATTPSTAPTATASASPANIANITMDLDDVEALNLLARSGDDNLTGADLKSAGIDLGADGQPDTVVLSGTDGRDNVNVSRSGSAVLAKGLKPQLTITGSEPFDTLRIQTLAGNDRVTLSPGVDTLISPAIDLGADD